MQALAELRRLQKQTYENRRIKMYYYDIKVGNAVVSDAIINSPVTITINDYGRDYYNSYLSDRTAEFLGWKTRDSNYNYVDCPYITDTSEGDNYSCEFTCDTPGTYQIGIYVRFKNNHNTWSTTQFFSDSITVKEGIRQVAITQKCEYTLNIEVTAGALIEAQESNDCTTWVDIPQEKIGETETDHETKMLSFVLISDTREGAIGTVPSTEYHAPAYNKFVRLSVVNDIFVTSNTYHIVYTGEGEPTIIEI